MIAHVARGPHTKGRIAARALAAALLVTGAAPSSLRAHAIHTTMTVVTTSPTGMTLNIRTFADDFSGTVARFAGRRPPSDSSAPAVDVARYVNARFEIRDAKTGRIIPMESCGIRRANELYWLCFRAVTPGGNGGVTLRNRMLTELHDDQVNIVQVESHGARRTMLFTKASTPASLAAGP